MNPINVSTETVLRAVIEGDPYHKQFTPLLDEIDRLRERLTVVEAERDGLHKQVCRWWGNDPRSRAERILDALQEPSDMVVDAIREYVLDLSRFDDALKAIHLAVAAAEKEVNNEN